MAPPLSLTDALLPPPTTAALTPASVPTSTLSPQAPPFVSHGRPKHEQWRDDSQVPMKNLEVSFRDILLTRHPPAPSVADGMSDPPAPRNMTTTISCRAALVMSVEQGWQKVESKRTWRRQLKAARPWRLVPADPSRQCFSCFSTSHRIAQC
jgi:hypothetical protein